METSIPENVKSELADFRQKLLALEEEQVRIIEQVRQVLEPHLTTLEACEEAMDLLPISNKCHSFTRKVIEGFLRKSQSIAKELENA